ncbi:MAG: hypothetical protein AABY15_03385 [Nanoarchaeota archaeon]
MAKKKIYTCKVCRKKYRGYRQSNTCTPICGMKSMMNSIEKEIHPTNKHRKEKQLRSEEFKKQIREKKGQWYNNWKKGLKKAIEI